MQRSVTFRLATEIPGNYREVMGKFDRQLFEFLLPKAASVELIEFTGSQTGDRVHLRFVSPIRADWISDIIKHGVDDNEAYFIDKGTVLPAPLTFWEHKHAVEKVTESRSRIVDEISFRSYNRLLSLLLLPLLYLSFRPRLKLYRKYFSRG